MRNPRSDRRSVAELCDGLCDFNHGDSLCDAFVKLERERISIAPRGVLDMYRQFYAFPCGPAEPKLSITAAAFRMRRLSLGHVISLSVLANRTPLLALKKMQGSHELKNMLNKRSMQCTRRSFTAPSTLTSPPPPPMPPHSQWRPH